MGDMGGGTGDVEPRREGVKLGALPVDMVKTAMAGVLEGD